MNDYKRRSDSLSKKEQGYIKRHENCAGNVCERV